MGDDTVAARLWHGFARLARRPGDASGARDPAATPAATPAGARERGTQRCGASGWRLRPSCTTIDGDTICPVCNQSVRTHTDPAFQRPVQVIQDHVA
jgi:hypothetical protein